MQIYLDMIGNCEAEFRVNLVQINEAINECPQYIGMVVLVQAG